MTMKSALLLALLTVASSPTVSFAMSCEYTVESGLVYGTGRYQDGQELPLLLDAYLPTRCDGKPAGRAYPIGFVHGGSFKGGSRVTSRVKEVILPLVKNGFAVFSIDYRLLDKDNPPVIESLPPDKVRPLVTRLVSAAKAGGVGISAGKVYGAIVAVEDAIKAKEWVSARADRFNIDTRAWGLMGDSAGAATVLGMAYAADDIGLGAQNPKAVVSLWGTIVPTQVMRKGEAKLLIVHGTEDETVPYSESARLLAQAKKVGISASRITMEGAGHSLAQADMTRRPVTSGSDTTVMDAIVRFFKASLRPD